MPKPKRQKIAEGRGPSHKLSRDLIQRIGQGVRAGAYVETVVASLGISKVIFYEWLKIGNKRTAGLEHELVNEIQGAFASAELRDILAIEKAAHGSKTEYMKNSDGSLMRGPNGRLYIERLGAKPDWKAAAWRLERKFPKRWGLKQQIELSGADGGPIKTQDEPMDKEALKAKLKEIMAEAGLLEGEE